ncbi:MAG TPA: lytic transglycosylase domain-containing protein [Thermoleophilaceae bacterium]|nr:lytic transglycosylase domain-containing protein [Thermoleophilaceae bacterium]
MAPRRRRLAAAAGVLAAGGIAVALLAGDGPLGDAVREITLPLRHDDIIRQQASDKGLDPALVAAVIYEESKFRDQTSHAGARGLMQITPATADFIARDSGGTRFVQADLATPQINISYGTYYLRYLMDRYDQSEALAVAAYNAGHGNVDRWVRAAGGPENFDVESDVKFPETRAYVDNVLERRGEYRDHYADELGL